MAVKNKSKKVSNNRSAWIVIGIFMGLAVMAFILYAPMIIGEPSGRQLSIPRISTPVTSSSDGESHVVDMEIVLEVSDKTAEGVDMKELQEIAKNVVAEMDYEKITGEGNTEYIKSEISKELEKQIGLENIKGIYLVDIQSDDVRLINPPSSEGGNRRNNVLRGIFSNIE